MTSTDRPTLGILLVTLGVTAISVNDMLVKLLAAGYPLHQIVGIRSVIAFCLMLGLVMGSGGLGTLRTATPGLHLLRGVLVVLANMTFYAAVAVMPLAQATALFFTAPLFITLLSIPFLGERVGPKRLLAVLLGFGGVLVMQAPWQGSAPSDLNPLTFLLPVLAALLYAFLQVLTRKLGVTTSAPVLAVYLQGMFLAVSIGMFVVAGDGRFAEATENESLQFLFRAWVLPPREDLAIFLALGVASGGVGYCLSAAYRIADISLIAPFEYLGLPLAILWGWAIFGEWPDAATWAGSALIVVAGLFVFLRENKADSPAPGRRTRPFRR